MTKKHFGIRLFYLLMIAVLIVGMGSPSAALAQDTNRFTATPLSPDSTIAVAKADVNAATGLASVIVKLKGDALASYQGDIAGLPATSPSTTGQKKLNVRSKESQAYLSYLGNKHKAFTDAAIRNIPRAKAGQDFSVVINAVAMTVPADQIATLASLPDVAGVYPDEILHPETDNSPQFIGATTIWNQMGGQENSGEGVIVGVIDTGIWPEHPSFSDPDPSGKPYAAPPATPSGAPRLCQFSGGTNPGPAFTCNNKLIGAYLKMDTYAAVAGLSAPEYTSARDADGHGTHTSSTAAGNAGVAASIYGVPRGTISGIAPRAQVEMFKVCGEEGCFSSDSAAAVQQAIADGVDVINFSISGGANPYSDVVEMAFLDAYNAGIFVAASAGNSGPAADTTDHRGPWVTTVAASTQNRAFENTLTLTADGGASLTLTGTSITAGVGPAPVFISPTDPLCNSPFEPGSVAGMVVVCKRGVTGRAEKGYNVLQGGAAGMILYNQAANVTDLETDNHYLPATHIQYSQGTQVLDFIAGHSNVMATLTEGVKVSAQGDVMASFSSRGGTGQTLGVSKPDITAPGVQILAGASPAHLPPEQGGVALGPEGELFQAIAGTSMSSPHIAGSGALLKSQHPDWTPGQIKSALMTTAWTQVVKEDGVTPATTFDDGSGRVDLSKAGDPGLTFDVSAADYVLHADDLWNVNYPSIYLPALAGEITLKRTAHSLLPRASVWSVNVVGETDFAVNVLNNLVVPAKGNAPLIISIDARNVPIGQVRSATLYLKERVTKNPRTLHIPITFIRKQAPVTLDKTCSPATFAKGKATTCTITLQNTTFNQANVALVDQLPNALKLVNGSLTGASAIPNGKTILFNGKLPAALPPDVAIGAGSSPVDGYLPLSAFEIAPVSGVGDETATNFNVPAFTFAGATYSRIGVVSDGYIIIGGASDASDIQFENQNLPNPTRPNNVIAPFWTDLNPGEGGEVRVATLGDGEDTWIVIDYAAVKEFSTDTFNTFEVWIGINGDAHPGEDISIVYGPVQGNGDGGSLTVGAENLFGNRGGNYYYNSSYTLPAEGTLPADGTQLVVTGAAGAPSEPHVITYKATGIQYGKWVNYAQLVSNLFQGISIAPFSGEVTK